MMPLRLESSCAQEGSRRGRKGGRQDHTEKRSRREHCSWESDCFGDESALLLLIAMMLVLQADSQLR